MTQSEKKLKASNIINVIRAVISDLLSAFVSVSYESHVHVPMQMIAETALPSRKMRRASRT